MASKDCFHVASLLLHHKSCKSLMMEETRASSLDKNPMKIEKLETACSCGRAGGSSLAMELRKKIMVFRDILDLPPCDGFASINEVVVGTTEDLHKLFPEIICSSLLSEIKATSIDQGFLYFVKALQSVKELWIPNHEWIGKVQNDSNVNAENIKSEQIVDIVMETLDSMTKMARRRFDIMDEDDDKKEYIPTVDEERLSESSIDTNASYSSSPDTPTSVLPQMTNNSTKAAHNSPFLLPLRLQAVGKLNPIDIKRLSFHMYSHTEAQNYSNLEETTTETKGFGYHQGPEVAAVDKIANFRNQKYISKDFNTILDRTSSEPNNQNANRQSAPSDAMDVIAQGCNKLQSPSVASFLSMPVPPKALVSENVHARAAIPSSSSPPPPPMLKVLSSRSPLAPPPPPPPIPGKISLAPPPPPPPTSRAQANAPPRPPPPPGTGAAFAPPPPPMPLGKGVAAPPPPPPGSLRPKKATSRLKRSSQIGNLYRLLRGKVEGSCLTGKSAAKRSKIGGAASTGGKQGMADALAEMTKRSAYFQQIEADVQKYAKSVEELKVTLNSFKTKDMHELLRFHKHVESILENLTDESPVLARCEGFPSKKLEALRTAAALYLKLDTIISELKNWKIESPLSQFLDKVERYFNKMKGDIDALERTKDEDLKKFKSHNIDFDFSILVRIKESMVDLSSGCMELALKERREANTAEETGRTGKQRKTFAKMLWRAFQFAFRVYTFAGGLDDRADKLTRELAHEIETDPEHQ